MKKIFSLINIFFISLIVIGGVTLFFSRLKFVDWLRLQTGLDQLALKEAKPATTSLDTAIFKSARFTALKNNVVNFDFDSICKRPTNQPTITVIDTISTVEGEATSAPSAPLHCSLGNNRPFRDK